MEEHRVCNAKVTGSNPVASTRPSVADGSLKIRREALVERTERKRKIQAEKRAWRMIRRPEPRKDVE